MKASSLAILLVLLQLVAYSHANWSLLGNFDPGRGNDQERQISMDMWTGKAHSVQLLFTTWDQQETTWLWSQMTQIWQSHKVPIISWEPWFNQAYTPSNIEVLIAGGQYDSYINSWGNQLVNWLNGPDGQKNTDDDRRVYIRFAHEFNGNWYPWSAKTGESTPNDYVRMWNRVKGILAGLGADKTRVQWIWSGICCEAGDFTMEQYFPGMDNVDWIGMGGMNFGYSASWSTWRQPVDLFTDMVARMRKITNYQKPLGITEYTTVTTGQGNDGKNVWITNFFNYVQQNGIRLVSYFNLDKDEDGWKDWAIFGGSNGDENYSRNGRTFKAFSGYRKSVGNNPFFVGSDPNLPLVISDVYFYGTGTCNNNNDCLNGYVCGNNQVCVRPGDTQPSSNPSQPISITPSISETADPSITPTISKSAPASLTPTISVTADPSITPTISVSKDPSVTPTISVTADPSITPSISVSKDPSVTPTISVTADPSITPSISVSKDPSVTPTISVPASQAPASANPSVPASAPPSVDPSVPASAPPSADPSLTPSTSVKQEPSKLPSVPVVSKNPAESNKVEHSKHSHPHRSKSPSKLPSKEPSKLPSKEPSKLPSQSPAASLSAEPSATPSISLSADPSATPSISVSEDPSATPSISVSEDPSATPSISVSEDPSATPSISVSEDPSATPSISMSEDPSSSPSTSLSSSPSMEPTPLPKKLVIYADEDTRNLDTNVEVRNWESDTSIFGYDIRDPSAPEGMKSIAMVSKDWAGFGFFRDDGIDIDKYKKITFMIKSTEVTRVELRDADGKSKEYKVRSTNGKWDRVTIKLNHFKSLDQSRITGLFVINMKKKGFFCVDDVRYE